MDVTSEIASAEPLSDDESTPDLPIEPPDLDRNMGKPLEINIIDDDGPTLITDDLVSNPFTLISLTDHLEAHVEHFGIKFYEGASIRKVNTLFDFIPLMDVTNKIANTKLLPDDEWTHNVPKKPPILDIKRWPP